MQRSRKAAVGLATGALEGMAVGWAVGACKGAAVGVARRLSASVAAALSKKSMDMLSVRDNAAGHQNHHESSSEVSRCDVFRLQRM